MAGRTFIIDAHPDPDPERFGHAVADAYLEGAGEVGLQTRFLRLADAEFPILRSASEFASEPDASAIIDARKNIEWADHLVFIFPIWMGGAPAFFRAFLEQVARAGFLVDPTPGRWRQKLRGKSVRLIVTMGMPAPLYRFVFGGHGVRGLMQSIFVFAGASPKRLTLFGRVETIGQRRQKARLERVKALGRKGA